MPGIDLIRCPGHVPGMMCVILRLENNAIIIAGDAISVKQNLDDDLWNGYWNPVLARNSAKRLSSIASNLDGHLFFGHDPIWWEQIKLSPDCYD